MTESTLIYRAADDADIPDMALLRAETWGSEEYWEERIAGYMKGESNPQHSLSPRILYVAVKGKAIIGMIAGHLTQRFGCDGELQWIDVGPAYRGTRVSSGLLRLLAAWFVSQMSFYICVDCDPDNTAAQKFYRRHGAENLNRHWLIWKDIRGLLDQAAHYPSAL